MMRQCLSCLQFTNRPLAACPHCGEALSGQPSAVSRPDTASHARLRAWLESRPRDERLILELHYADGLGDAEIAQLLDFGESYVTETRRHATEQAQEVLQ